MLAKIRGLRVASRTSAFSFKGTDTDIPTIAQKLSVSSVLEGSVRITAQPVEVASDSHLWSRTYDRELDDIFAVQDDIAQSVVRELRAALLGETADAASSARIERQVSAAEDLFEPGRQWLGWAPLAETFELARAAAEQALRLEPDLAKAHAELGWVRMTYDWDWRGAQQS